MRVIGRLPAAGVEFGRGRYYSQRSVDSCSFRRLASPRLRSTTV